MSDKKQLTLTPTHPETDLQILVAERKTVATLLSNDCRWPFGDPTQPDFRFCGKHAVDGRPYCEFHTRSASQPTKPRIALYRPHAA